MTKEQLKEYRILGLEAEQLEQELLELMSKSIPGSAALDGLPKGSGISDITAALALDKVTLYARLNAKKLELLRLRKEIEDCIEGLSPSWRLLMRERYILCKSWEDVCEAIGYSWRQTHYIHTKILKELSGKTAACSR